MKLIKTHSLESVQTYLELLREPPYDNVDEKGTDFSILDEYSKRIEKAVRESPDNWLWTHKRWKRAKKE